MKKIFHVLIVFMVLLMVVSCTQEEKCPYVLKVRHIESETIQFVPHFRGNMLSENDTIQTEIGSCVVLLIADNN